MTAKKIPFCTDEEIMDELKKLGYNDISRDVFDMMKDDLSALICEEQYDSKISVTTDEKHSASTVLKYQYNQKPRRISKKLDSNEKSPSVETTSNYDGNFSEVFLSNDDGLKAGPSFEKYKNYKRNNYFKKREILSLENMQERGNSENVPDIDEINYNKEFSEERQFPKVSQTHYEAQKTQIPQVSKNYENKDKDTAVLSSSDGASNIRSFDRYKNTFKNYKMNNYSRKHDIALVEINQEQENIFCETLQNGSSNTDYRSSVSVDTNKIKRKSVKRHKDGKPVITEEYLNIPSIFSSSYPEAQSLDSYKSFSSDDLSWKSNSSTGSITAVSPDASNTPQSNFSLSTTRSVQPRFANVRRKKNDPVTMYNYYKKFWNEFKPPGEKTHDKIRWAVRDKMLDYNL
ncbi:HYLS1_C domain-containing protein [Caerostris extrusa]|uniref:HYLS1_C domain-containing protein n=1 Tax=Caerostris extrusa TaxID=172846 RepID=A0AAV4Y5T2_CAEEX|nr:HYLS1_C domain-containing protein [Caerostris extrusa]